MPYIDNPRCSRVKWMYNCVGNARVPVAHRMWEDTCGHCNIVLPHGYLYNIEHCPFCGYVNYDEMYDAVDRKDYESRYVARKDNQ